MDAEVTCLHLLFPPLSGEHHRLAGSLLQAKEVHLFVDKDLSNDLLCYIGQPLPL